MSTQPRSDVFTAHLNQSPIADAGQDQNLSFTAGGTSVILDGSGSSDSDLDILTFTWTGPLRWAEVSRQHRFVPSTKWPPRNACTQLPAQRRGLDMSVGIHGFDTIVLLVIQLLTSDHYNLNVNTT